MRSAADETAQFRWQLAETIAWCSRSASLANPATSLRTHRLCPPGFTYTEDEGFIIMQPELSLASAASLNAAIQSVVALRAQWLRQVGCYPPAPARDLAGGRLLCYDPYENLAEACEAAETAGFYDANAAPPWDTWVCYTQAVTRYRTTQRPWYNDYLISWVPAEFVATADWGLQTSTTECVYWADNLDSPLLQHLRVRGVL